MSLQAGQVGEALPSVKIESLGRRAMAKKATTATLFRIIFSSDMNFYLDTIL